jgi:hypothetical protein
MIHPDDDTGDALRRLEAHGDSLTAARDIDFAIVFREQSPAEIFATHFREQGFTVSVEEVRRGAEFPWDVVVVKHMVPTHQGIEEFETRLQSAADELGGQNDGWGCLTQQD